MKTMSEIRQHNLKILSQGFPTQRAFADALDTTPGYVSQLLIGSCKFGEKAARKIEKSIGKPNGWLDVIHSSHASNTDYITGEIIHRDAGELPYLNYKPKHSGEPVDPGTDYLPVKMGSFKLQAGFVGFAIEWLNDDDNEPIYFRADWFKKKGYKQDKLVAGKIQGDSMTPRLYPGDLVIINTDDTQPKDGKVFAINYEGELLIKRMVRDNGQWWIASDNADKTRYPNKLCTDDLCFVIGRVVHKQSNEI